jgi:hypothetical protein
LIVKSAFSAISARVIALRIENPYSILRQIANLPQLGLLVIGYWLLKLKVDSAFSASSARVDVLGHKKSPLIGASGWSVADHLTPLQFIVFQCLQPLKNLSSNKLETKLYLYRLSGCCFSTLKNGAKLHFFLHILFFSVVVANAVARAYGCRVCRVCLFQRPGFCRLMGRCDGSRLWAYEATPVGLSAAVLMMHPPRATDTTSGQVLTSTMGYSLLGWY